MLIYIQLALRSSALLYYFKYYLQLQNVFSWIDNFGLFNGIGLAFTILGVAASKPLVARFGKHATFRTCLIFSALFMASFALAPLTPSLRCSCCKFSCNFRSDQQFPILWAMMADVADYSEWQTGRRSTALAFASIMFGLKLGFGIGGLLNGHLLEYFGYTTSGTLSSTTRVGILMMATVIPAAVLCMSVCVLFGYRLNDDLVDEIGQTLQVRRNSTTLANGTSNS